MDEWLFAKIYTNALTSCRWTRLSLAVTKALNQNLDKSTQHTRLPFARKWLSSRLFVGRLVLYHQHASSWTIIYRNQQYTLSAIHNWLPHKWRPASLAPRERAACANLVLIVKVAQNHYICLMTLLVECLWLIHAGSFDCFHFPYGGHMIVNTMILQICARIMDIAVHIRHSYGIAGPSGEVIPLWVAI